ncbi:MAG: glycine cleavage system protein H [Deltaproteobacteria bacterium]|nr:glycine cleavage system protein H [Deltaproteobacteria bacterium]
MSELTALIQTPAGFAIIVFGGIVALMIVARLAFFGMFFFAVPVAAVVGGLRTGMRWFAARRSAETSRIMEPRTALMEGLGVTAGEEAETTSKVEGFRMPRNLWYHPKHIWMKREPDGRVRIGFDDFAQRLIGAIRQIDLLTFNVVHQMRKSEAQSYLKGWDIYSDGKTVRITSPIRGRIEEINDRLGREPSIIGEDPYGEGWLCTIVPEDDADLMDETISGMRINKWMRDEVHRLRHCIRDQGLAVLHDGGEIAQDIASAVSASDWRQLVKSFLSD